ncbi:hypothetical protein BJ742DRAFT_810271 [Cladochytrium replicatum]|nr:hypothetical protein BJ742DRAFT_810271 [Cladochytrium replicatum]
MSYSTRSLEVAGSIIRAIETTNAVIAGMIAIQAIQFLTEGFDHTRNVGFQLQSLNNCPG